MEAEARRLIVAVKWGPLGGRKAVLAPGESLRVGRGELSGLVIPGDPQLSAVHCEISWDGERGHFRDLKSAAGTVVNGERGRAEGDLKNGDWLKAGDTVLTIHVEDTTPPRADLDDDEEAALARQARTEAAARALPMLREEAMGAPLYAVLDAARDKRILELCRESVEEYRSLYDGVEGETMAHVAPYLVRLPRGSRLLDSLVREGWGKRWGIYLTSRQPFAEVRRHLRRFLMVEMEGTGERVYFRYYDPHTLWTFLPTSTPRQRQEFFGSFESYLYEDKRGVLVREALP